MILIGLGANLPSLSGAAPVETLEAALVWLRSPDIAVKGVSPWFEAEPVPVSAQPWFVNGVAELESGLDPLKLLTRLHDCEKHFGRRRAKKNEARIIDLDLLAYHDLILTENSEGLILPHPRMHLRKFVLLPLRVYAPAWRHPVFQLTADRLLAKCPDSSMVQPLQSAAGSV